MIHQRISLACCTLQHDWGCKPRSVMEYSSLVFWVVSLMTRAENIQNWMHIFWEYNWKCSIASSKYKTVDEAANVMGQQVPEVRLLFSLVETLIRLLLVIPITSCEAKRSFSSLRRLKTWLRSTIKNTPDSVMLQCATCKRNTLINQICWQWIYSRLLTEKMAAIVFN